MANVNGTTEFELQVIQQLKQRLSDLNLSEEFLQAKNLVRFVRARNGQLDHIEAMVRHNIGFYETHDTVALLHKDFPPSYSQYWPATIVSLDDYGGPVVHLPIGKWDANAVIGRKQDFYFFNVKMFETAWTLMSLHSKGKEYIPQFSVIVDLEGLGWRHYTTYDALHGVLNLVRVFESTYPETLKNAVLLNAPSIFNFFWKLIRPILSEVTQNKISILGNDKTQWTEVIQRFAKPCQYPSKYGGELEDGQILNLDKVGFWNYVLKNNVESSKTG